MYLTSQRIRKNAKPARLGAYIPGGYPLPAGGPLLRRGLNGYIPATFILPTVSGRYLGEGPVDLSTLPLYTPLQRAQQVAAMQNAGAGRPTQIIVQTSPALPAGEGITAKLTRWLSEDIAESSGVSKGLALAGAGTLLAIAVVTKPKRRY